ncbi:hypothetical protein [Nocardia sp. CS682]|uniref:hypothetical protein n=1 Tax=Nocardia sp. CS682 TaxID=1047172 RepID=UPI00107564FC|nr:hypothetical protein [Nocardia sp. CS682]
MEFRSRAAALMSAASLVAGATGVASGVSAIVAPAAHAADSGVVTVQFFDDWPDDSSDNSSSNLVGKPVQVTALNKCKAVPVPAKAKVARIAVTDANGRFDYDAPRDRLIHVYADSTTCSGDDQSFTGSLMLETSKDTKLSVKVEEY